MQNKLLPCPFCERTLKRVKNGYEHPSSQCILSSFVFTDAEVEKWNTRKPMERIITQLNDRISNLDNKNKICMDVGDFKSSDRYAERMCEVIKAREIVEKGGVEDAE